MQYIKNVHENGFMGVFTIVKSTPKIIADIALIAIIMGISFPAKATPSEPLAVASHSAAVESRNSEPMAKMVPVVVNISSIIGRKKGNR